MDIIGLNKKIYQTARQVIQLNILKKTGKYSKIDIIFENSCFYHDICTYLFLDLGTATNEIRFKINNLNVEDMFQEEHIPYLLDIFRHNLWMDSKPNLYVTFLASASDLGQRLPLDPNDTEG